MSKGELLELTISELAPMIRARQVSPREVTEAALAQADRLQPVLNSFITILYDQARSQAEEQEKALAHGEYRGPLHGIPVGIKDNIATAGIRTTVGSKVLADHVPEDDAYKPAFKKGWLNGYRVYCGRLGVDWSSAPSNLDLLEQIILARNTVQHPEDITSVRAPPHEKVAGLYPRGFFADALELAMLDSLRGTRFIHPVRLGITHDNLRAALDEVDGFCEWLDAQHPLR